MSKNSPSPVDLRSPLLFRLFGWYARGYLRRNFHALRVSGPEPPLPDGPVLVVMNHPGWWDPMLGILLAERWGDRLSFAPMDADALERYGFFKRLGFFPVQRDTKKGARAFLKSALAILASKDVAIWVTAQGRFSDCRERPLNLQPGVGHIARLIDGGALLPLAIEYSFWEERTPEALIRFGDPIEIDRGRRLDADEWTAEAEAALERTMDELAAAVADRELSSFRTLIGGKAGVGGVYDLWRRFKAMFGGQSFQAKHGQRP